MTIKRICIAAAVLLLLSAAFPAPAEEGEALRARPAAPYCPEDTGTDKAFVSGEPDRPDPHRYPYSAVARIETSFPCGCERTSTGFLVSSNVVLTGAGCMVCPEHGTQADRAVFCFGYRNKRSYICRYSGEWKAWTGNAFENGYRAEEDYCAVRLREDVGLKTGWLGAKWETDGTGPESCFAELIGYVDGTMCSNRGYAEADGPGLLTHGIDGMAEAYGGPLITTDFYAVGINTGENGGKNVGCRMNSGVREAFGHAAEYREEGNGPEEERRGND